MMAQPTLNSNEMMPFGTYIEYQESDNLTLIDTSIQGSAVTWNFQNLTTGTTNADLTLTCMEPNQTPYGASFPNANFSWKEGPDVFYSYYNLTPNKMERVGSATSTSQNEYTDPQIEYVFPLTYGTTSTDSWNNTQSSFGGTYNFECVGYGTLNLPGATHNDVLMVRARLIEGFFIDINVYYWYDSHNGIPLLIYLVGDGFFILSSGLYVSSISVGINEHETLTAVEYNNPVRDHLTLSYANPEQSEIGYTIHSITGQQVMSGVIAPSAGLKKDLNIDVSQLIPGIYLVSLKYSQSKDHGSTFKVVKL
jgi:hypothetical protein